MLNGSKFLNQPQLNLMVELKNHYQLLLHQSLHQSLHQLLATQYQLPHQLINLKVIVLFFIQNAIIKVNLKSFVMILLNLNLNQLRVSIFQKVKKLSILKPVIIMGKR